jgi:hypothetical protein
MRAVCCVLAAFCVAVCEGGGNVSDQAGLFLQVYGEIFTLRDGSVLADTDTRALDTMKTSVQRLLGVPPGVRVLDAARVLPEDELLRVLFLAVAGNFTVADRGGSGLPQRCALVVDAGTGELALKDSAEAQSVILEVLLIVSIVCLMRTWGGKGK